ncbi:S1 RNA-binding domain-containing protein [Streptomyces sp. cf386]|uniref:S1 RNA-binding domain-containing protein n=1 Tax=Streptomyces sp. cf386 TaxID=1761904 RepID=UPI000D1A2220|nr:S1 RNA-binding domain-containing protein [Streptomyces sp. cf386]
MDLAGLPAAGTSDSELADGYSSSIKVGDALPVKILEVDLSRRRITLSHRQAASEL